MVGCILKREKTYEEAEDFMAEKKRQVVCHSHFTDAIVQISKVLNIENDEDGPLHPGLFYQNLKEYPSIMDIVSRICPEVNTRLFRSMIVATHIKYRNSH
uniref:GLOBIN domain-containing protein n=1 Tax=Caenorhabditis tropicalis TaxID=1561998 RepID=A0A1I7SZD5_9PELO